MTYTYDLTTDRGKVRLWANDTNTTAGKLTDAEIDYCLTVKTTVEAASIMAVELILGKLADPNFTADWLTVDNASAYKSLSAYRLTLCRQFGIPAIPAAAVHPYRADSRATDVPTYPDDALGGDEDDLI